MFRDTPFMHLWRWIYRLKAAFFTQAWPKHLTQHRCHCISRTRRVERTTRSISTHSCLHRLCIGVLKYRFSSDWLVLLFFGKLGGEPALHPLQGKGGQPTQCALVLQEGGARTRAVVLTVCWPRYPTFVGEDWAFLGDFLTHYRCAHVRAPLLFLALVASIHNLFVSAGVLFLCYWRVPADLRVLTTTCSLCAGISSNPHAILSSDSRRTERSVCGSWSGRRSLASPPPAAPRRTPSNSSSTPPTSGAFCVCVWFLRSTSLCDPADYLEVRRCSCVRVYCACVRSFLGFGGGEFE